jgi:hypothetical protein
MFFLSVQSPGFASRGRAPRPSQNEAYVVLDEALAIFEGTFGEGMI